MEQWDKRKLEQYSRPPRLKPRGAGRANTPVLPGPDLACRDRDLETQLLKYCSDINVSQASRASRSRPGLGTGRAGQCSRTNSGFTLLEVMIAMAIIAIALVAVFGSQSQSLSLANEAKFNTTAALLAQRKIAEITSEDPEALASDSGDFGEDFPNYHWGLTVSDVTSAGAERFSDHLKGIDLTLSYGQHAQHQYRLRLYRFVPKTR